MRFADFNLSEPLLRALDDLGYETPTPIQAGTIEHLLADRDVIGQAQTGTGKTAAFMLPILERLDHDAVDVQALVLCPTRELAIQVTDATRGFAKYLDGVEVLSVYGGSPIHDQIARLGRGVHVVVGTPGRVLDLLRRGALQLHDARMVVLDEADEMLSMGFIDDIRSIMRRAPWGRQTAMFSATMPPPIRKLAEDELHAPVHVSVAPEQVAVSTVRMRLVAAEPSAKLDRLEDVLDAERPPTALVFTRTKIACSRLSDDLYRRGRKVRALHGDMQQSARDSVMIAFRAGRVKVLVATDVAARGLDVSHISHVINYELPDEPEVYVHRIGRTGRVGRAGEAISLVSRKERRKVEAIEELIGRKLDWWDPTAAVEGEAAVNGDVPGTVVELPVLATVVDPDPSESSPPVANAAAEGEDGAPRRRRRGRRGGRRRTGEGGDGGAEAAPAAEGSAG